VKNVTLPTEDGGTTQIDHIIVSTYGVFVVETKKISKVGFLAVNIKKYGRNKSTNIKVNFKTHCIKTISTAKPYKHCLS
jgi:hypothetical protein